MYFSVLIHTDLFFLLFVFVDVSCSFVLRLLCQSFMWQLHEKHNNTTREEIWHPQLSDWCLRWQLWNRWVFYFHVYVFTGKYDIGLNGRSLHIDQIKMWILTRVFISTHPRLTRPLPDSCWDRLQQQNDPESYIVSLKKG